MSEFFRDFLHVLWTTLFAVLPVVVIVFTFQLAVLRRRVPNLKRVLIGLAYVLLGLTLFLLGLEKALFPLGENMVAQLTDPAFIQRGLAQAGEVRATHWYDYYWVFLFAASIGFATTLAEPALLTVAHKAQDISGGAVSVRGLRITVALGVGLGMLLGSYRIVAGIPLHYFVALGCMLLIIQTYLAPRAIVALAYDTGVVATSTVTVPLVIALGLGLASNVPGRHVLIDGFGLIALTCLFPIVTVLGYAQLGKWWMKRNARGQSG